MIDKNKNKESGNDHEEKGTWVPASRKELGKRIKSVIEAAGGYEIAAELTHKSVMQLRRYVSGGSEPPFGVIVALADATGVSMSWIAFGSGIGPDSAASDPGGVHEYEHPQPSRRQYMDKWLLSRAVDGVRKAYSRAKVRLPTVNEIDLALDLHDRIVGLADGRDARHGALLLALDQLERDLRTDTPTPQSSKRQA